MDDKVTTAAMTAVEAELLKVQPKAADAYGHKYAALRQKMIADGDGLACNYENIAKRYNDMATKIREQVAATADRHIDDLLALDQAEEAIARHFKQAPPALPRPVKPGEKP